MKRLSVDPLEAFRSAARDRLNAKHNDISYRNLHRDLAHRRKREIAEAILAGSDPTSAFAEEAKMRGVSVSELAENILSREPEIDARELVRQKEILQLEAAKTPQEIEAISPAPEGPPWLT